MDGVKPSLFFALPAEIRNEIYSYYLEDLQQRYLRFGMVNLKYTDHLPVELEELSNVANDLLICEQFYFEALDYFFKININHFFIHFESLSSFAKFMNAIGSHCPNFKGVLCVFVSSSRTGIDSVLLHQVKTITRLIENDAKPLKASVHRGASSVQHLVTLEDSEGHALDAEWVENKRGGLGSWCRFRLHLRGHLGIFPCTKEIPRVLEEQLSSHRRLRSKSNLSTSS
jgi:hypothetical protein